MATDFFDEDLLRTGAGTGGYDDLDVSDGVAMLPISDVGLNRLSRQKQEVTTQVAGAVQKIEHLRSRQQLLEREKQELEELAKKQDEYESGKRDMIEKLGRWLIMLDKEKVQAVRMVELLGETFERFRESLAELEKIDENKWKEENFQLELNKALVRVDIARSTYTKAMAKIEAANWQKRGGKDQFEVMKEASLEIDNDKGFFYWLKVGLAVTLPLVVVLICLFAGWFYLSGRMGV